MMLYVSLVQNSLVACVTLAVHNKINHCSSQNMGLASRHQVRVT